MKKVGCTALYNNGIREAVTLLHFDSDPVIVGYRTVDKDGYNAVIVGFYCVKDSDVNKSVYGFFKNKNIGTRMLLLETRVVDPTIFNIGSLIKINEVTEGSFVDIASYSIGKGFAGVMKRHNFAGLRASHGVSLKHRSGGSIGQCQDPGKVFKGAKMAGRMGGNRVISKSLLIRHVDVDLKIIAIKGSVAGCKGSDRKSVV